ncbi:MAG: hypothetical protein IK099_12675, partial [Clostridia bacterium]|nr:hypothetical protein [Clostridia bacterium]
CAIIPFGIVCHQPNYTKITEISQVLSLERFLFFSLGFEVLFFHSPFFCLYAEKPVLFVMFLAGA